MIENFSLEVPKGEMVAIVGPTGAGKTTIINLLERFYEVKGGQIYLDGQETRSMSRDTCAAISPWFCRIPGSLPGQFLPISSTAGKMPVMKRFTRQPAWPGPTASSASCRMAMRPC
ncbi:ATP-binding cassette domain-containing protein [Lactobacillus delbrueckii subsp. bulgaricus]|nr:ATP-binding cassette domain-containing protein [Lactobacillus delbrueckii subsp. lactis]TLQ30743.1 ATP-binding cassette domain-containing protein [Lactobacillus delbrueckii subsp. bulgaricus]MCS8615892.1 ATP-binding cassette domain-containing protein [Lactobacillus delbrueckii subsp. lactis]MCT0002466.1 ATP-binding cassette domain-containing protein [Lactobacillus delbrueckii subsp. lactis]MCT3482889.1 ATP-binding cassette domain-containing protein [Lactobacillus delbrueckii subsp. lactis]